MGPDGTMDFLREALWLIVLMSCLIIVPSLIVGLIVSVFQAATQINEQTLSFLPRLVVTLLAILFGGPWMMNEMVVFFRQLLIDMPSLIG